MPNNTKSKSNGISSVGLMIIGVVCLMIASLMMFFPGIKTTELGGNYSAASIFFRAPFAEHPGIWPVFIGYMFIFLSGIATLVMALPVVRYSWKFEKNVFIGLSIAELVGGILVACICLFYSALCRGTLGNLGMLWGSYLAIFFTAGALVCNYFILQKDKV